MQAINWLSYIIQVQGTKQFIHFTLGKNTSNPGLVCFRISTPTVRMEFIQLLLNFLHLCQ